MLSLKLQSSCGVCELAPKPQKQSIPGVQPAELSHYWGLQPLVEPAWWENPAVDMYSAGLPREEHASSPWCTVIEHVKSSKLPVGKDGLDNKEAYLY